MKCYLAINYLLPSFATFTRSTVRAGSGTIRIVPNPIHTALPSEPVFVSFYGAQESISSLAGRYDNLICRTGPPGYIGWCYRFLGIDFWALYTFTNTGSVLKMCLFSPPPSVVGRATVLHPEDSLTYRMTSSPRGLALLIGRVGKTPGFFI